MPISVARQVVASTTQVWISPMVAATTQVWISPIFRTACVTQEKTTTVVQLYIQWHFIYSICTMSSSSTVHAPIHSPKTRPLSRSVSSWHAAKVLR